jgi:hypothetical protein
VATYANQIQVLTLRNAELETQNARLLERLRQSGDNVAVLLAPRRVVPNSGFPYGGRVFRLGL